MMRFSEIHADQVAIDELAAKKRLGARQKATLAKLSDKLAGQPPATPRRAPTGERGDFQGNVYAIHSGSPSTMREQRRSYRFARFIEKPLRSRALRRQRKQRTGGVK